MPTTLSGDTFGHVLGTNTSAFEIFALKRKVMGPCWLEIKDVELSSKPVSVARPFCSRSIVSNERFPSVQVSWCKLEVVVSDPKNIRPLTDGNEVKEMPPLTIMSLAARTIVNHKENTREIVCATARVWEAGQPPSGRAPLTSLLILSFSFLWSGHDLY